jgi:hypothetical protein
MEGRVDVAIERAVAVRVLVDALVGGAVVLELAVVVAVLLPRFELDGAPPQVAHLVRKT